MRLFEDFRITPGLAVHIWPTKKFKTVHMHIYLHSQLSEETATLNNLLPAVLTRGTAGFPETRRFNAMLDGLYGAGVTYSVSRRGERGLLTFSASMADIEVDGAKPADVLSGLLYSVMFDPAMKEGLLRPDYVAQERAGLANDMAALRDDKDAWADFRCAANMCSDEPFGIHPYGDEQLLKSIGPEPLTSWWSEVFPKYPADVFISGDFDALEALEAVNKHFAGRFAATDDPGFAATWRPAPESPRFMEETADTAQTKLAIGWRGGFNWASEDYPAHALANHIFGQYSQSKLFINVREKEGLAYSVGSRLEPTKGLVFAHAGVDPQNRQKAIGLVLDQHKALAGGDVTDKELSEAKKSMALGIRMAVDSPGAVFGREMTGIVNGRRFDIEEAVARIAAVKAEEVASAASRWKLDMVFTLMPEDFTKEEEA